MNFLMKKATGFSFLLALLLSAAACNHNDTSYTDKERDSMNKVDSDTAQDLFKMIEAQEQQAKESGQAAPDAQAVDLNPAPKPQEAPRQNNHPGPIQPPPEIKR